jgi:hypothetical protein
LGLALLDGRGNHSGPDGLGKDQAITGPGASVGQNAIGMDGARYRVAKLNFIVPNRVSAHDRRLALAQLAREAEAASRMSGTAVYRNSPRVDAREGWTSSMRRDALGRIVIDWSREDPEAGDIVQ